MYVTELFPFCCHEDYHRGRLECLCVCVGGNWGHWYSSTSTENLEEEAEIPAQSNVGGYYKRMCVYVDYLVLMCACSTYVCKHLFFSYIHSCLCGLHKELHMRREGFGYWALSAYSGGWSVGSFQCACMSVGPVCAHRVGVDKDRESTGNQS